MERPFRPGILDYGPFEVNEGSRLVPITGYVLISGELVVLVDTGFPAHYVDDPFGVVREEGLEAFGRLVSVSRENLPSAQLALAGIDPGAVGSVRAS